MIAGLEKDGLICRERTERDGRKWFVYITEKGKELYLQNRGAGEELNNMLDNVLTKSDIVAFNRLYNKVVTALSEKE